VNLNLRIIINDQSEFEKEEDLDEERVEEMKKEKVTNIEIESEIMPDCIFDDITVKEEPKTDYFMDSQVFETGFNQSISVVEQSQAFSKQRSINLEYLNECISKVIMIEYIFNRKIKKFKYRCFKYRKTSLILPYQIYSLSVRLI
jgi:hypothetical protein